MLGRVAAALTAWSQRWIPSAFSIACLLTFLTFGLAILATDAGPGEAVIQWGNGFWTLLPFAMQMGLVILTGYIVSSAPIVDRMFARVARLARSPRAAVLLMALVSTGLAWLHWGLSLIGGAMLVRHVVRAQPKVDYRLLVAVAYFGLGGTWHAGLSGSAPLLVATPGHFLEGRIGIIPATDTIFTPFNLGLTVVVMVLLAVVAVTLHPKPAATVTVDAGVLDDVAAFTPPLVPQRSTFATLVDHTPAVNLTIAAIGAGWLAWYFGTHGFALTLDVLNFAVLMLGVALHRTPASLTAAAEQGARLMAGIALQFPFYAGIFGIVSGTGLAALLGEWMAQVTPARWFPLAVYWYSGFVNYFVPSGGSKWAIEAPYLIEAASRLGVPVPQVVVAYAWGDMSTNLIQPFWALPLLAAARLDFRDIAGYAMLVCLVNVAVVSMAFAALPWIY